MSRSHEYCRGDDEENEIVKLQKFVELRHTDKKEKRPIPGVFAFIVQLKLFVQQVFFSGLCKLLQTILPGSLDLFGGHAFLDLLL